MLTINPDSFSVNEWINSHINAADTIESYEEQVSQMLNRLQMNSRESSMTAEHNIKALVHSLPQSMAQLSNIVVTVDAISESLRNLTNSGYQFKTGNVPDKISELSSLKIKRDRLREATEKLQNGVRIESDLQKLQSISTTGPIKSVCEQYSLVLEASKSLSNIAKFNDMEAKLKSIRSTIEQRVKQPMITACASQNSMLFSENAALSRRVFDNDLPSLVVKDYFQNKIKTILNNFNDGEFSLSEWLKPCYSQCQNVIIQLSDWCLSLNPKIFGNQIRNELIDQCSTVLTSVIEIQSAALLQTHKFDELVVVFQILQTLWKAYPEKWNLAEKCRSNLFSGMERVGNDFSVVFRSYLDNLLNKPLPKSTTSGDLRAPPSSPIRSPSVGEILSPPSNTAGFDQKLDEFINLSKKSLQWISVISSEKAKCVRYLVSFLSFAISGAMKEMASKFSKNEWKSDEDELNKFKELLKMYVRTESQHKEVLQLESEMLVVSGSPNQSASTSTEKLRQSIIDQIIRTMSNPSIRQLSDISKSSVWDSVPDEDDEELGLSVLTESKYIIYIEKQLMNLIQLITSSDDLDRDLFSEWMLSATQNILASFISEIKKIPKFSQNGKNQLIKDINYLQQVLNVIGMGIGNDLDALRESLV